MGKYKVMILSFLTILLLVLIYLFVNIEDLNNRDSSLFTAGVIADLDSLEKREIIGNGKLYWDHMPLTYSFIEGCPEEDIARMKSAFRIIENSTDEKVTFIEEVKGDIKISCSEVNINGETITEGETKYNVRDNKIRSAEMTLFRHMNCGSWPDLEVHEALHLFGYEDVDDKNSIMNSLGEVCDLRQIDSWIVDELIEIYG